jgi:hypothetical protein
MKKNLLLLVVLISPIIFLRAQTSATEGKIEYKKGEKPAAVIELPYSPEVVEGAIKDYLSLKGLKLDRSKGFQVYRGARLDESDELSDLHFKVEKKSKKEKDVSVVYLMVGKPDEDLSLRSLDDRYKVDAGINFLNNIVPSVESYSLNVDIDNQEDDVKKAERKLKELEDEQEDIEKKIKNLQQRLEENREDQRKQADEVSKKKIEYETLKARKKA